MQMVDKTYPNRVPKNVDIPATNDAPAPAPPDDTV
jgi:hypothetical protein